MYTEWPKKSRDVILDIQIVKAERKMTYSENMHMLALPTTFK